MINSFLIFIISFFENTEITSYFFLIFFLNSYNLCLISFFSNKSDLLKNINSFFEFNFLLYEESSLLICLYVFTSKKHNETTIFRGKDIISKEKRDRLLAHHEAHRKIDEEFNKNEKNQEDEHNRGFIFYTRAMYDQRSSHLPKGISNDYFLHPQREEIEKKIINWITEIEVTEQSEQFHITQ